MRNILIVISGPSGVGKGTIASMLCENDKNIELSISCTTRLPRSYEQDKREYFFISKEEFQNKISQNGFLEYSEHFDNFYGTPKDFVLEKLKGNDVILEIDVNGGLNVKKNFPDAVLIMLLPPSIEEIKSRLLKRSTESEQAIKERMERIEYELDKKKYYDYTVVNDNLEKALKQVQEIIKKEKNNV